MAAKIDESIDLRGVVPGGEGIEFLSLELSPWVTTSLGRVQYSVNGKRSKLALRFDLGKVVFLDRFEDEGRDKVLQDAAPAVLRAARAALAPSSVQPTQTELAMQRDINALKVEQRRLRQIIAEFIDRSPQGSEGSGQVEIDARLVAERKYAYSGASRTKAKPKVTL